jgi:hypothetical protein
MVAPVRYDDAALAINSNPERAVELRCCAGAVRKSCPSGPSENFHAAGSTMWRENKNQLWTWNRSKHDEIPQFKSIQVSFL